MSECKGDSVSLQGTNRTWKVKLSALSDIDKKYIALIGDPYYGITPSDVSKNHAKAISTIKPPVNNELIEIQKFLAENKQILDRLYSESLTENPRIGDIGRIMSMQVRITQILSTNTALVSYNYGEAGSAEVLLTGVSMNGLADNSKLTLPGLYTIADTFKFNTALGALRTVYVMRRATDDEVKKSNINPIHPVFLK